jgi:PST family polysaccharide transporter
MNVFAILSLISKGIYLFGVYVFIKSPDDIVWANLSMGLGMIISSIFGFYYIFFINQVKLKWVGLNVIKDELSGNFQLLLSQFSGSIYVNSTSVFLKIFASDLILGYYGIIDKLLNAARSFIVVYAQATYPITCDYAKKSRSEIVRYYRKVYLPFSFLILFTIVFSFFFTEDIICLIAGYSIDTIILPLNISLFAILIISSNIGAGQFLLAFDKKTVYAQGHLYGVILSIPVGIILTYFFQLWGAVFTIIFVEIIISFYQNYHFYKQLIQAK